jgi:hypothetical protein
MREFDLFIAALERDDPADRNAYLTQACGGDVDLLRRVERLLRLHGQAGSFLEPLAAAPGETVDRQTGDSLGGPEDAKSPPRLSAGRYQLLDEIAHGGMGVIWHATDTTLGREVAVKVLIGKFAPDSGVAHRFEAEARITAQLQHPAIPPVHDYGKLADDRPFLAMKLIKGSTLEDLLRQRADPAAERGRFVAVFEQVCQAVAYYLGK